MTTAMTEIENYLRRLTQNYPNKKSMSKAIEMICSGDLVAYGRYRKGSPVFGAVCVMHRNDAKDFDPKATRLDNVTAATEFADYLFFGLQDIAGSIDQLANPGWFYSLNSEQLEDECGSFAWKN
jgi:hypothetical protein